MSPFQIVGKAVTVGRHVHRQMEKPGSNFGVLFTYNDEKDG